MLLACIPGSDTIDLKKFSKLSKSKNRNDRSKKTFFLMTRYVRGGFSPIGIRKKHKPFIHKYVLDKGTIIVSAGMRGLQIELKAKDLIAYLEMTVGYIIV